VKEGDWIACGPKWAPYILYRRSFVLLRITAHCCAWLRIDCARSILLRTNCARSRLLRSDCAHSTDKYNYIHSHVTVTHSSWHVTITYHSHRLLSNLF